MKKQGTWKTVAALFAFAAFAPAGAAAETYAKPVPDDGTDGYVLKLTDGYVLKFFEDEACTKEKEQKEIDGETTVFFANNAEFQALALAAPDVKKQVAKAKGGVPYLQSDVSLEADCDWRAFDFNINGKTITLAGYKLSAGCIAGEGTITAGELVVNGDFDSFDSSAGLGWNNISASNGGWDKVGNCNICITNDLGKNVYLPKRDGSNWAVLYKAANGYTDAAAISQTVTLPKDGTYYLAFRYQRTKSNYSDELRLSVTGESISGSITNDTYSPSASIKTGCIELENKSKDEGLELKFACSDKKYGLCIDDVSLTPLSILELKVPEGAEYDAGGLTLKGTGLQVVKSGAGRIVFSKDNASWRYNGYVSLVVEKGYAKQTVKNACGAQYSKIEVCDGAQFDFNGKLDWDKDYTVSNGTLTSTAPLAAVDAYGNQSGNGFLRNIVLSGDATIRSAVGCNMGVWFYEYEKNTMTMGGRTLTYDSAAQRTVRIFLGNMSYSGEGKIVVAPGCVVQTHKSSPSAPDCDVEVFGGYWQNTGVLSPVKSLVFREDSSFRELNKSPLTTIVYERYAPPKTSESETGYNKRPLVQLGDEKHQSPTLDLSYHSGVFYDNGEKPTLRYYNNGDENPMNVKVDVSERNCVRGRAIYIYGKNKPANVRFVAGEKMVAAKISLRVRNLDDDLDGLYTLPGTTIVIR